MTFTFAWDALQKHHDELKAVSLSDLFYSDKNRFQNFSLRLGGLLFDYSKNRITPETLSLLLKLADARQLEQARAAMLSGEKINVTENRAVLHTALRAMNKPLEVKAVLEQMTVFTNAVRDGRHLGYSGKAITDVVNIGIGGSSLGPQLVAEALTAYHHPRLTAHFVSNVEASDLENTLKKLSPETTLFVIASKTFTTAETLQNAAIAREWFLKSAQINDIAKHFVAVSTNLEAVKTFGIAPKNMFPFWDWVGGRYSVWSAIGLSIMLMVGTENFHEFLNGAARMDDHFQTAPMAQNMPVIMGLIGIWYRNFCDYSAQACIPYHSSLRRFTAWLQQLDMESNGKSVDKNGTAVNYATGAMVFGETGTDSQHSFFQWLHQSPTITPVDFIAAVTTPYGTTAQQTMLLANCLAQSEALMTGQKNTAEPHRHFTGNRPSSTILLDALTPHNLGMLMALYEHKVFVQGIIWNINSFDQWGVELGKSLAKTLQNDLTNKDTGTHDASTKGLIAHVLTLTSPPPA
jgi:glucose-6-phosphate isomerase